MFKVFFFLVQNTKTNEKYGASLKKYIHSHNKML